MSVLEAFRSLPVVRVALRPEDMTADARSFATDTATLGWEDRLRSRGRRRSDGGVEFGLALPRGSVLRGGDCLVIEDRALVVRVVERAEPVLVITPATPQEWALFAYQIGNGHQPLMLTDCAIVCPVVTGMEALLDYHGIAYERASRTFTPTGVLADHRHGVLR